MKNITYGSIFDFFKTETDWTTFSPGLKRVRKALKDLGNPDHVFKSIVIGGTNGKGTVTYNLAKRLGESTGLFQSPHLVDIRERITLSSKWINDEHWEKAYQEIKKRTEGLFSYYEWLFLIACLVFRDFECKWAVFEVGMGGRLDAVNALEPICSGLTSISLDHERFLGNTKAEIAAEKVEICRLNKPFFISESVLKYEIVKEIINRKKPKVSQIPDLNRFQDNAILVDAVSKFLGCDAMPFLTPPGRREVIGETLYLDTAHNESAWRDTMKWLESKDISQINILFALTGERKPKIFKEIFQPVAREFFAWGGDLYHSIPRRDYELAGVQFVDKLEELLSEPLFVCGTHSLVGLVRKTVMMA